MATKTTKAKQKTVSFVSVTCPACGAYGNGTVTTSHVIRAKAVTVRYHDCRKCGVPFKSHELK